MSSTRATADIVPQVTMPDTVEQYDELQLLRRAESFERDALSEVHERYYSDIFRYISFRVQDYDTTADLTSDVFERLLRALRDRNAPRNTIRGWLYGTAKHVVQDFFRQLQRQHPEALSENLASDDDLPEKQAEQNWHARQLNEAMRRLTEEQQHVLAMRFGQGLSIQETAAALNKSEGSVKMLQARAVAALTEQLQGKP